MCWWVEAGASDRSWLEAAVLAWLAAAWHGPPFPPLTPSAALLLSNCAASRPTCCSRTTVCKDRGAGALRQASERQRLDGGMRAPASAAVGGCHSIPFAAPCLFRRHSQACRRWFQPGKAAHVPVGREQLWHLCLASFLSLVCWCCCCRNWTCCCCCCSFCCP